MARTILQKITSSLWVLVSFLPLFNGLGFVYIGNEYANSKWFAEGILYGLPLILGVITIPNIALATGFLTLGFLTSIVCIIRSIMVDFTLQKQLDQSNLPDKSFENKVNDFISSLWVFASFIPFFNGAGLMYKGKSIPKKSLFVEGIVYELPWIIGLIGIGFQPVRFVAFEVAFVFYFISIIRSIMVATEPKPSHAKRDSFAQDAKFKEKKEQKVDVKKEREEKVTVNVQEGVVPAFKFYEKKFNELAEIYPAKEKNAMELIEKRFAPPQLTYTRFKQVVDDSHETFYSQLDAGRKILDLSTEYSTKVEDELKNKVLVLNSIIQGLDKLSEELVLNISKVESESDTELENLFEDFSRVTSSVKAYE